MVRLRLFGDASDLGTAQRKALTLACRESEVAAVGRVVIGGVTHLSRWSSRFATRPRFTLRLARALGKGYSPKKPEPPDRRTAPATRYELPPRKRGSAELTARPAKRQ
jgi:hypothetical protein